MALTSAEAAALRNPQYRLKRYLSVCPRQVVFQARQTTWDLDADSAAFIAVHFDTVTLGHYQDILPGYTVELGTSTDPRAIGVVRARKAATADTIFIAETAPGELHFAAGYLTVRVIEERALWQRLPYLRTQKSTGSNYYDTFELWADYDLEYTDEHSKYRPVVNIQGQPAGWVDAGQDYRTVPLDATQSLALADGAALSGIAWDLVDGVLEPGYALSDWTIRARFPATRVFRYVSATVTDSNGKTATRYFPVFVHSAAHPPLAAGTGFEVERDETQFGGGRALDVTLFGPVDAVTEDIFPQRTLLVYWEEVDFGGEPVPDAYRGQFLGWSWRDSTRLALNRSEYFVQIGGPAAWLDQIDGIQESFLRRSAPSEWYHMADVTDDRAAACLLRERTTALDVCDFHPSGVTAEWGQPDGSDYAALKVDKASLWQQITQLAAEYSGFASCDSLGGIWLRVHNCLLTSYIADRDAVDELVTLTGADVDGEQPLELPDQFLKPVGLVEADGFYWTGSASEPYRAHAPGKTPSYGAQRQTLPTQVLPNGNYQIGSQHLSRLSGMWWAWLNNPVRSIPLQLMHNLDVFEPALHPWIRIQSSIPNVRGKTLDARFVVESVSTQHSNQPPYKRLQLTVSQETSGAAGQNIPIVPQTDNFDWIDPNDWYPGAGYPLPVETGALHLLKAGQSSIAVVTRGGNLWLTGNFDESSPNWDGPYSLGMTDVRQIVNDAFSPGLLGSGSEINARIFTSTGIYYLADAWGARSVSLQHTLDHGHVGVYTGADASFSEPGFAAFVYGARSGAGTRVCVATDGETWTETQLAADSGNTYSEFGCYVSSKIAGKILVVARGASSCAGWESGDYGASWGLASPAFQTSTPEYPTFIHVPYEDNDDETTLYYVHHNTSRLHRLSGGSDDDVTPFVDGVPVYSYLSRWVLESSVLNRQRLALAGQKATGSAFYVLGSDNAGGSWSTLHVGTAPPSYKHVALAGDDQNVAYVWGGYDTGSAVDNQSLQIGYTDDWFASGIQDKRGDMGTVLHDEIVGIFGGGA